LVHSCYPRKAIIITTKADDNGPFKEFDFGEWLRDGVKGLQAEMKGRKKEFFDFDTSEFRSHLRNASKEQLLAIRSLIDKAIETIEKRETETKDA
jgi:hypothetical protein